MYMYVHVRTYIGLTQPSLLGFPQFVIESVRYHTRVTYSRAEHEGSTA